MGLFLDKGKLIARWTRANSFPQSRFCERPSVCVSDISIATNVLTSARLFSGGVVYATREGKIYFTEIDVRESPLSILLASGKGGDLRLVDDTLLIKIGTAISEIEL
jgi:hypothetical protein